jgi:hypothetical protein
VIGGAGTLRSGCRMRADLRGAVMGTLGVGALGTLGAGVFGWLECCLNMSAMALMASIWLWPMCAKGVDGMGFLSTWMRDVVACMATSVGVLYGTVVCCGKIPPCR